MVVRLAFLITWFVCLGSSSMNIAWAESIHQFESPLEQARYEQLTQVLRCPKCQNQSLSDSDSAIASDLRDEVYRMITLGKSDNQVKEYMVARYGEFVLYEPVFEPHTFFLWFAPFGFLLIGVIVFVLVLRAQRKQRQQQEEV
ncbi:cytochrome c-type biogenesis protein [Marinomonas mediterranea]|uniref:Cytochrome c-type biogenesis protein n=1 Tax=Marinomonas mediterranea (strain ATCC 700492 / JCM 21426 / NBRC 103028 / MMB-1) TaxID=717774 RepID=F2K326_MARM1|nr:cytochrome c-type biogenesis protein [Marinomonas mediterranea]ADZ92415.1 cytochrome C biogenesis protein [Marinomonas mediterranea MMB-1]WCN18464.1 cytochrome c-type biogenesis protein CcmH [Marinomonas mediterranea MMB-1]